MNITLQVVNKNEEFVDDTFALSCGGYCLWFVFCLFLNISSTIRRNHINISNNKVCVELYHYLL